MAKKVSKHSRAARRCEAEEPEASTLASLPRNTDNDLTSALIRTTSRNEALLEAKLVKKRGKSAKVGKKVVNKNAITHMDKERLEKALSVASRLDGKIEKSKSRAQYVQRARKAGWDATNTMIKNELESVNNMRPSAPVTAEKQQDMVVEEETPEEDTGDEPVVVVESTNVFANLMNDVEA